MAKNKNEYSKITDNAEKSSSKKSSSKKSALNQFGKKKRALTVWDHHDTMIVNLRSWVERAIENLKHDANKLSFGSVEDPTFLTLCSAAIDLNNKMWDKIRSAHSLAESRSNAASLEAK